MSRVIGAGGRRPFRLRTGLPPATTDAVLMLGLQVLAPVADVVVVTPGAEATWPARSSALRAQLEARADEPESRPAGPLRGAVAAVLGGRHIDLEPARSADLVLAIDVLPFARSVAVLVAADAAPVLLTDADEPPLLRLTEDELVRLRDALFSKGLPPEALVALPEAKALERTTRSGLLTSAVLAVLAASNTRRAVHDLLDGYGGWGLGAWVGLQLVVSAGGTAVALWWLFTGLWRRRRHRARG